MNNPEPNESDPLSWLKQSVQSVMGGWLAWVAVCIVGSGVVHAAGERSFPVEEFCVLWLWHWILSGLAIWGFLLMSVHAMLLRQLILGTDRPMLLLAGMLLNQMTMGLGADMMFEEQWRWGPFLCWLTVFTMVTGWIFNTIPRVSDESVIEPPGAHPHRLRRRTKVQHGVRWRGPVNSVHD